MFYPDGKRFEGTWREGAKHGRGYYIFPDGNMYQVYYSEGNKVGQGKILTTTTKTIQDLKDEY